MLYWVVMFVATHWPEIEKYGPRWQIPHFDKLVHAGLYAGWVVVWWWLLSRGGRAVSGAAINWLVLGGAAYGVFDETTQAIVGRSPAIGDFAADVAGLIAATVVLQLWQGRRRAG